MTNETWNDWVEFIEDVLCGGFGALCFFAVYFALYFGLSLIGGE